MIEKSEISAIMRSVAKAMREYVALAIAGLATQCREFSLRFDDMERRLKEAPSGRDGKDGKDGVNGKDGTDGRDGEAGRPGIDGKDGAPGLIGADGISGKDGAPGLQGFDGTPGKDGRDGRDGLNGRDALELEVLPVIDPAKMYPRGTFATHNGGTLRAVRNTEGSDALGWSVVMDGVALFDFKQDEADPRTFHYSQRLTSGISMIKTFTIPAMIFKGVFTEGVEYVKGETVQFGGSIWHCNRNTKAKPGDNTADWTLVVRRGRDGNDAREKK